MTSLAWPMIPLGEVVRQRREFITIDDLASYKRCRVQLRAQGIVLRDTVPGVDIKTKQQQTCRPGDLLVAEIDAKHGGGGIVPAELDGAIVSSHYFLFEVDDQKLDQRFLGYYLHTPAFLDQIQAQGSTNYAAIRPEQVLGYRIPLPPLPEQRRLVARIEALAGKVDEAKRLRAEAAGQLRDLKARALTQAYLGYRDRYGARSIESLAESVTDGDHITPPFLGEGVKFIFVGNVSSGILHFKGCKYVTHEHYASLASQRRPRPGDVLYSSVGATLGVPAVVDSTEEFCFQRHIAIVRPRAECLTPRFLWYMLRSEFIYRLARAAATGSAQPTVPLRAIREFPIPYPPIEAQVQIVGQLDLLLSRLDEAGTEQIETEASLVALLPAILDKAFRGEL
ncbi:MAG: restriction endonuclease subunit S [Chloroflexi bacterium]|nr:restriction endonuclease subunit S [Chloroflexota bacterium]